MEEKSMYVMIDNFDSFVYNLKAYFQELGREILVRRCDEITLREGFLFLVSVWAIRCLATVREQ